MTKNHAVLRGGSGDGSTDKRTDCSHSMMNKKVKKNLRRLGGKGLSLEAFVNAKTKSGNYNPSLIKKQKEFYKNAKFVKKYKRLVKAHDEFSEPYVSKRISEELNETAEGDIAGQKNDESRRSKPRSIKELYEKRREEEEKKRIEREAIIQAKKEERQRAEVQRKQERQKMFKKTKSGQPVMKYRIEHLLQTLQGSSG